MGAVRLRGSAWILPETPETTERFQWLVQKIIAEIVHEADLHDGKFTRHEASGVDLAISALAASTRDDHELLERGMAIFDGLHTVLKKKT